MNKTKDTFFIYKSFLQKIDLIALYINQIRKQMIINSIRLNLAIINPF